MIGYTLGSRRLTSMSDLDADEVDGILADGATLPALFYTDPGIAELEDDLIFRRAWQIVGVEPELRRPGDYFTTEIGGYGFTVPIVVLRDREMRLRAFVNICRHRANVVARGYGNRRTFQCDYHGWVYGLDGCLRAVPRSDEGGLPPFEELGLFPLPVDSWKGYVFVTLEEAEPLATALGELPRILEEQGFEFPFAAENVEEGFTYEREVRLDGGPSNWKTMHENNIECYHCPVLHKRSFSSMYKVDPAHYTHREFDRGIYHTTDYQDSVAEELGLKERGVRKEYQFYFLWPSMYLSGGVAELAYGGTFSRLWPDGVNAWRSETVRYRTPLDVEVNPEVAGRISEWWRLTLEEDRDAAGRVQKGLGSGLYSWGYTLAESERNMRHFYGLVWKALAPAFRT